MLECLLRISFLEKFCISVGNDKSIKFLLFLSVFFDGMIVVDSISKILILNGDITLCPYFTGAGLNALEEWWELGLHPISEFNFDEIISIHTHNLKNRKWVENNFFFKTLVNDSFGDQVLIALFISHLYFKDSIDCHLLSQLIFFITPKNITHSNELMFLEMILPIGLELAANVDIA